MTTEPTGNADQAIIGPVTVGVVAHGGHCVARVSDPDAGPGGRVVFVRHALPGEQVLIRITDTSHKRFWRGDAVEILVASADRREAPCPIFHPGGCGGCDFQHATEAAQRELKRTVVAEQLQRLAGIEWTGDVEEASPVWGWRTRMRYQVTGRESDGAQRLGMRVHRSHAVIGLPDQGCAIAAVDPRKLEPVADHWSGNAATGRHAGDASVAGANPADAELLVVTSADGVSIGSPRDRAEVTERAAGRDFAVDFAGFWQVHPAAADTLVAAVLDGLQPQAGERAFDLYCGVGLFAGALADRGVQVWGLESGRGAVAHARRNVPEGRFSVGRVEKGLRDLPGQTDLVVLDPPRAGAGKTVMEQISRREPRAIAYVACDPAALARDLAHAGELGWQVRSLRAFDLFPQTHHIECVAVLER
ncbi:MAG: TRAM domain-containing protein [Propionibacteriaceae bacterium]|nr:TRAM domain-containing protein [Propionibacteriaceae bacterium]